MRCVAVLVLMGACAPDANPDASSNPTVGADVESRTPAETDWPEDVAEVYRRAEATLLDMGLTHVTVEQSYEGIASTTGTRQLWLDAAGDRYRDHIDAEGALAEDGSPADFDAVTIGLADATWYQHGPGSARRCHDVSVATSVLLGCRSVFDDATVKLEQGEPVAGAATIVLVTAGTASGSDTTTTYTERMVADAATGLPLLATTVGEINAGQVFELAESQSFEYDVLDPDSLPEEWFDPAAAGFPGVRPATALPVVAAVPWLGEQWRSESADLPTLVLATAEPSPISARLYDITLTYGAEGDPYGPPMLLLYGWDLADWTSVVRPAAPCETSTVDGREIHVFCGGAAVSVAVFDGDRVAEMQAPTTFSSSGAIANPFATRDALVEVATAIEWREPTPGS